MVYTENDSDINRYRVTVNAILTFFTDSTMTTQETLTAKAILTVYVNPCEVTEFRELIKIEKIESFVGNGAMNGGNYEFSQGGVCNYPQTITLINLPSFATHNEINKDFTI